MIPELQPIPKGLKAYDRWIDVDLSDQTLVAYQGQRPVFATMVSTGKKGSAEESFQTPTGRFRIYNKQVTSTMDGTTATDGNYAIQDVPWVMYFEGSYALHGAFWHQSFGRVRSHGCVNLGPSDARWLFFWTTPFLPEGWHGVNGTDDSPGTTIIIHE
jgi:lipoprotein-anchoring transpeptidase ErfK/SrfK